MELDLFGAPEPVRAEPQIFSVTEVTRAVRTVIEEGIGAVWVEGEISNCRRQSSGHQYFTLKDANAQLPCVLFARPGMWRKDVPLSDGMHVRVRGAMTVYEARGQYQMNVQIVRAAGEGLLQAKFEALKRKLQAEGLFDQERKRALPAIPASIGIVTSPSGAALHDMLQVLTRRAPWLHVVVSPARVQGEGAAEEIVAAIVALNQLTGSAGAVELIVVARGGGSAEDLAAFNEEIVARAIVQSALPVVSAIGHEIDFTIADFSADLRAPTPSAAAELIAPDTAELLRRLATFGRQLTRQLVSEVDRSRARLNFAGREALVREPRKRLDEAAQRLDVASELLGAHIQNQVTVRRRRLAELLAVVRHHRPDQMLALLRLRLGTLRERIEQCRVQQMERRLRRLQQARTLLRSLAPEAILKRGFSMTMTEDGAVISASLQVKAGSKIITRLRDGTVRSTAD